MRVLDIAENKDGSANINIDATEEEIRLLIEKGFVTLLEEYIDSIEE